MSKKKDRQDLSDPWLRMTDQKVYEASCCNYVKRLNFEETAAAPQSSENSLLGLKEQWPVQKMVRLLTFGGEVLFAE